ncbi:hypothetical protein F4561_004003 [Lipingzhangella halophila]|uniref:Uncharacterized protein n=1 Tax=Lipingzhangella halophila TaxID=1783352 RepID=A0A7W7RJJ5_9ACTN|nr:hypothetical protein [Lipingzhangella halophila]MBB4933183.1 hypothetical protein [Lipingzhangella halophila]
MRDRIRRSLGMPLLAVCGLALLGVPRVVAHDLELVGPVANSLLVWIPVAVWLVVVLWCRVPNAFRTLLVIGLAYGMVLGVTHQVLWTQAFDEPPSLGGNLEGVLAPAAESALLRMFAFLSSLGTGALVGAVTGVVGWLLAKAVPALRPRSDAGSSVP